MAGIDVVTLAVMLGHSRIQMIEEHQLRRHEKACYLRGDLNIRLSGTKLRQSQQ
jgi:hypothetical protein